MRLSKLVWLKIGLLWLCTPLTMGSEIEALSDEIDPSLESLPEAIEARPIQPAIKPPQQDKPKSTHTPSIKQPLDEQINEQNESSSETKHGQEHLNKDKESVGGEKAAPKKSNTPLEKLGEAAPKPAVKAKPAPEQKKAPKRQKPLHLLGTEIPPGLATRVAWRPGHSLKGLASQAPVLVVHGKEPGPTLCIAAAVHGDELNGIEVVRQVLHKVKASKLKGTLIGVPIVNIQGFLRNSRYLVDRRDLNRFFPGTAHGSLASRIAHSFFNQVILNCSALVDVHTGSFYRDNLPQLRADLNVPSVVQLTEGFGSTLVLHSSGAQGTLRKAAVNYHIPAVTLELGGPMILDENAVEHGVEGIFNLLDSLEMYTKRSFWGTPKPVYYQSLWVRAEQGGIFFSRVKLGDDIAKGDTLGTITNPITNEQFILTSPHKGEVVGLAHNQVVYPGFATTHLAIKPTDKVDSKSNEAQQMIDESLEAMENDE